MSAGSAPPRKSGLPRGPGYRWVVFSRVMAALGGGYALSALGTAVLSLLLPRISGMGRAEAVLAATLASFIWYAVIVIWVFATRSARRAWTGVVIAGFVLGVSLLFLRYA